MKANTGAHSATNGALTFGVALGNRLRQIREQHRMTVADVARYSDQVGLHWNKTTVTRVENGRRNVTASELFLLAALVDEPVANLLPVEPVALADTALAPEGALLRALHKQPRFYLPDRQAAMLAAIQRTHARHEKAFEAAQHRHPNVPALTLMEAVESASDDATVKVAQRLGLPAEDVALASLQLWDRSLVSERDARVADMPPTTDKRARQARRGHVTRTLLAELQAAIETQKDTPNGN